MNALPTQLHLGDPESPPTARRERKTSPPALIACSGCDSKWSGIAVCHCSGCHRTFTSISAFDIHRTRAGECLDPATVVNLKGEPRLVPVDKPTWSGWARLGGDTRWIDPL